MTKFSSCPRCGAMVNDSQYYCGQCGTKLEDEALTEDYGISFESISAVGGHFGSSVRYVHGERIVLAESWGSGASKNSVTVQIPKEIQTKRALNQYLDQQGIHR